MRAHGVWVRARAAEEGRDFGRVLPAGTPTGCQVRPAPARSARSGVARLGARRRPGTCAQPVSGADARARDFLPRGEKPGWGQWGCRGD